MEACPFTPSLVIGRRSITNHLLSTSFTKVAGESAGGVAPPAALRTGRDSLLSSGPHSPAGGECDEVPVGEEGGLVAVDRRNRTAGIAVVLLPCC